MTDRYIVKEDTDQEQFKIVDTGMVVGGDDADYVWVASAYERADAEHIAALLNQHPHAPLLK